MKGRERGSFVGRAARAASMCVAFASLAAAQTAPAPGVQQATDEKILGTQGRALKIESIDTRVTAFEQYGYGYQSQAGPLLGPGSEHLTVLEPQVEVVHHRHDPHE